MVGAHRSILRMTVIKQENDDLDPGTSPFLFGNNNCLLANVYSALKASILLRGAWAVIALPLTLRYASNPEGVRLDAGGGT